MVRRRATIGKPGKRIGSRSIRPGEMHADVNAGDKPIEGMVAERKHDK